jgi:putative hydrolase of the HAD superfamily
MKPARHLTALFDWGDTVMRDNPASFVPMVEWEQVWAVDGIAQVLAYLQASGRRCVLATSAAISDESQIRGALARAGLDDFFERIYAFKNTGLPKGEAFYRHILQDLELKPEEALMVGDHLQKDVIVPNGLGMYAVWFNPSSAERREGELHTTVHSMKELLDFLRSLDNLNEG